MQTVHATHIAQSFVALPSFQSRITAAEAKPLSVSLPYRHKIRVTNVTMATAVRISNTTSDSLTTELSRTVVPCALKNNSWLVYN